MTVTESLESMQESLYIRFLFSTGKNRESLQHSLTMVNRFLSDYLKWSGEYAGAKQS